MCPADTKLSELQRIVAAYKGDNSEAMVRSITQSMRVEGIMVSPEGECGALTEEQVRIRWQALEIANGALGENLISAPKPEPK